MTLFADGFNVPHMLATGLIGAGIALAVGYGTIYRARRAGLQSAPAGAETSRARARLTWTMLGVLLLCLALVFGGIFWRTLAR